MQTSLTEIITREWKALTYKVLDKEPLSLPHLQSLLADTYSVLTSFHKNELVPKSVCKMLLATDEFLYFASMMEENENKLDFYHYQLISQITEGMKKGFFDGEYEETIPKLKIYTPEREPYVIDFEKDIFE